MIDARNYLPCRQTMSFFDDAHIDKTKSYLFFSFVGTVALWTVNAILLAAPSFSQPLPPPPPPPPPSYPYEEETVPVIDDPLPPSIPPPTFETGDIPPRNYSPSVYREETSEQFKVYRLDVGDGISVNVSQFPEFSFTGIIDPEGNVLVPILGRVPVVGLTLDEVENKIRYELGSRYLKEEPELFAFLTNPRPAQITVLGEVIRPGYYALAPGTPISAVLLSAGGSTTEADLRSIVVRRTLVDGTIIEENVDLYTPLISGTSLPSFRLQGGDTVIVSKLEIGQDQDYDRSLIARTTLTQSVITVRVLAPRIPSGVALRSLRLPNGSNFLDVVASLPISDRLRINVKEIALVRFDPEKGRVVTQSLSPKAAINGEIAQNIPLEDQDVIVVSRTLLGEVLAGINILTQPIRDIFGLTNFFERTFRRF